jgi:hypothetical protein
MTAASLVTRRYTSPLTPSHPGETGEKPRPFGRNFSRTGRVPALVTPERLAGQNGHDSYDWQRLLLACRPRGDPGRASAGRVVAPELTVAMSRYRIVLRGRLSERFESAFDGMALEHGPNRTVLVGDVRDQAQLYGLIGQLQEFGIELLAVEPADNSESGPEAPA